MESSSEKKKIKWIDYLICWKNTRLFTFVEEFGNELIVHTTRNVAIINLRENKIHA